MLPQSPLPSAAILAGLKPMGEFMHSIERRPASWLSAIAGILGAIVAIVQPEVALAAYGVDEPTGCQVYPALPVAVDAAEIHGSDVYVDVGVAHLETVEAFVDGRNQVIRAGDAITCTASPGPATITLDTDANRLLTVTTYELELVEVHLLRSGGMPSFAGDGGLVQLVDGTLDLHDSHVSLGDATLDGGCVHGTDSTVLMDSTSQISGCSAGGDGGGVYLEGLGVAPPGGSGPFVVIGVGTVRSVFDGDFQSNDASRGGHAFLTGGAAADSTAVYAYGSAVTGGGLYAEGTGTELVLTGGSVTQSTASGTIGGGGIDVESNAFVSIEGPTIIQDNQAYGDGGGIRAAGGGQLLIGPSTTGPAAAPTIAFNTAGQVPPGAPTGAFGGAIHAEGVGTLVSILGVPPTGGTPAIPVKIEDNVTPHGSGDGGGVSALSGAVLVVDHADFRRNAAGVVNGTGGAILAFSADFVQLLHATVDNNSAPFHAVALYAVPASLIGQTDVTGNPGGGIRVSLGSLADIFEVFVQGNLGGAGLHVDDGSVVNMPGSAACPGGICNEIQDNTIGVLVDDSDATLESLQVKANDDEGIVVRNNASVLASGLEVRDHSDHPGVTVNASDFVVDLALPDCPPPCNRFVNNLTGAIDARAGSGVTVEHAIFRDNVRSGVNGGSALHLRGNNTFAYVENTLMHDNSAPNTIFVRDSDLDVVLTTIADNDDRAFWLEGSADAHVDSTVIQLNPGFSNVGGGSSVEFDCTRIGLSGGTLPGGGAVILTRSTPNPVTFVDPASDDFRLVRDGFVFLDQCTRGQRPDLDGLGDISVQLDPGAFETNPTCGDGVLDVPEEECDDGDGIDSNECSNSCTLNADCNSHFAALVALGNERDGCDIPLSAAFPIPPFCAAGQTADECAIDAWENPAATMTPGSGFFDLEFVPRCIDGTQNCDFEDVEALHCTDGSRPGYYHDSGSGSDQDRWVFYLGGEGGKCSDLRSPMNCFETSWTGTTEQKKGLTSRGERDEANFEGVMDPRAAENDLDDWSRIRLDKCGNGAGNLTTTGLGFVGTTPLTIVTDKEYHHGLRTWKALFQFLHDGGGTSVLGTDFANAEQILIVGHSDAAEALIHIADELRRALRDDIFGDPTLDVRVALDGHMVPSVETEWAVSNPLAATCSDRNGNGSDDHFDFCDGPGDLPPGAAGFSDAYSDDTYEPTGGFGSTTHNLNTGNGVMLDASCVTVNGVDSKFCHDKIHVLLNHVRTPMFVQMDQLDAVWLGTRPPHAEDDTYRFFAADFAERVQKVGDDLIYLASSEHDDPAPLESRVAMYSQHHGSAGLSGSHNGLGKTDQYNEPMLRRCDRATGADEGTFSPRDVLATWLAGPPPGPTDNDHAFLCGNSGSDKCYVQDTDVCPPAGAACTCP